MAMQNAQMSQAPMGARTPSPMNHPQQINMNAVSTVRYSVVENYTNNNSSIKRKIPNVKACKHLVTTEA